MELCSNRGCLFSAGGETRFLLSLLPSRAALSRPLQHNTSTQCCQKFGYFVTTLQYKNHRQRLTVTAL